MFCIECGKEIPDGVKFCPDCGASQIVNLMETEDDNWELMMETEDDVKLRKLEAAVDRLSFEGELEQLMDGTHPHPKVLFWSNVYMWSVVLIVIILVWFDII